MPRAQIGANIFNGFMSEATRDVVNNNTFVLVADGPYVQGDGACKNGSTPLSPYTALIGNNTVYSPTGNVCVCVCMCAGGWRCA